MNANSRSSLARPLFAVTAALGLFAAAGGCASMGFSSDTGALVKQASFDHNCPADKIKVVRSMEGGIGEASFVVDVCGTEQRYKRLGTMYVDQSKGMNVAGTPKSGS